MITENSGDLKRKTKEGLQSNEARQSIPVIPVAMKSTLHLSLCFLRNPVNFLSIGVRL